MSIIVKLHSKDNLTDYKREQREDNSEKEGKKWKCNLENIYALQVLTLSEVIKMLSKYLCHYRVREKIFTLGILIHF